MNIIFISLVLLVIAVIVLSAVIIYKNTKIKYLKNVSEDAMAFSVVQKMFEIMGSNISANKKLKELNTVFCDIFKAKYSTIVLFDGKNNLIKASNVPEEHACALGTVSSDNNFTYNVSRNVAKYVTVSHEKTLTYNTASERGIKSAIFSPIYDGMNYVGFWLLEDRAKDAFENVSQQQLTILRKNLAVFLHGIKAQEKTEKSEDLNRQTGIYNMNYFYNKEVRKIEATNVTSFMLVSLQNLKEINLKYNKKTGDKYVVTSVEYLKNAFTSKVTLVRYSGTKILVIFKNMDTSKLSLVAEKLQARMLNYGVNLPHGHTPIKTKIAISEYTKDGEDIDTIIKKMDTILEKTNNNIALVK